MRWETLISMQNLKLAWRRINTGRNLQHKHFFREAYLVYEAALDQNLKALRSSLQNKAWQAEHGVRIYLPKPSGLQRPITLLNIENQIMLQALANLVATKLRRKRKCVELVSVFSNRLASPSDSIFFTERWQSTYQKFQEKCEELFNTGHRWSAHFDLSAYYDTISHDILKKIISPKNNHPGTWQHIQTWLQKWSAVDSDSMKGHGIPQGPIASDFLAEAFFLPIDLDMMKRGIKYIRYVDDIRLFGNTENEVRQAAIILEQLCRERGLIPQSSKFGIKELSSVQEAMGALPSIPPTDGRNPSDPVLSVVEALRLLITSLNKKHSRVDDKSRFRYVMYRAPDDPMILRHVIRLLPRHPEHIDAFTNYFSNYSKSRSVVNVAIRYLQSGVPYSYVRGELYHVLARLASKTVMRTVLPMARSDARKRKDCMALSWGVMHFLLKCEAKGLSGIGRRLNTEGSLSRSLLACVLPDYAFLPNQTASEMLQGSLEEQLAAARELQRRRLTLANLKLTQSRIKEGACRSLRALGVIRHGIRHDTDWIADRISKRYNCSNNNVWRSLFGTEYEHALQILIEADACFDSSRSNWLSLQDSFNDALVRQLFTYLSSRGKPGHSKTHDKHGKLVDFGNLIQKSGQFDQHYSVEAGMLRDVHERRSQLPESHPYSKKGGARNRFLEKSEQPPLVGKLKQIYEGIITIIKHNP